MKHIAPHTPLASSSGVDANPTARRTWRDRLRALWSALVGGIGLAMGIVPHVLHHVTILAGTALVAGSGGTALFGALTCPVQSQRALQHSIRLE